MADLSKIPGLGRNVAVTRLKIAAFRGVKAFSSALLLAASFLLLALAGVWDWIDPAYGAIATLIALAGGVWLTWRGRARFQYPSIAEARHALDAQSEFRPIASLTDRPASVTQPGQALWRAHMDRLSAAAAGLRPPSLAASWRAFDPAWLRAIVPAAIAGLAIWAGADAPGRIGRALSPDYGSLMGASELRVDAWITPPAYSGRAPVFLTADMDEIRVPAGSEITVRAQSRSAPRLRLAPMDGRASSTRFERTPDNAFETKATIDADARISVRWWGERAAWTILASPDAAPRAIFVDVPKLGDADKTEFTWEVEDDYGVETLSLSLRLVEPHPAAPDAEDRIAVPMRGVSPKEASEAAQLDMTRHRWAGLEVEARLIAVDGAGQEGRSEPHVFILPTKLLLQPLAKSIQEIRVTTLREPRAYPDDVANAKALTAGALNLPALNRLETAPAGVRDAAFMLDAITYEAPRFFKDYSVYLALRTSRGILGAASSKPEADSVEPILWAAALKAEYGSAADALAALLAAKKALETALRDGASEEEIRRLTEAFRQAAENYIQAKIAEAIANGLPPGEAEGLDDELSGGGSGLGGQDLEDMLNALQDLTETGAADQARRLLSDITNLLENLQFQQGNGQGDGFGLPSQGGESDDENATEEERELSDAINDLSDILRDQRELNDDTLDAGRRQSGNQQSPNEQGRNGQELAERQEELGDALGGLLERESERRNGGGEPGDENTAGLGGLSDEQLEAIQRFQERAADALRNGRQLSAESNQERATGLLRDALGQLASELDELREERGADPQNAGARDPFGRNIGGADDSDTVEVPDEAERQKAKDILEELRRRFGAAQDEDEQDYLERLLDRF